MSHFVIFRSALCHQRGVKALIRAGLVVAGCFCAILRASGAHAADRVALAYETVAGCPAETDFKAAVERRGGQFGGPGAPGAAQALRISIIQEAAGFRGTLQATNEDATSVLREVHGATCQEVVEGLSIVGATALKPQADSKEALSTAPPPEGTVKPQPERTAKAEPEPTTSTFSQGRLRATKELVNAQVPVEAGTLRFDYARAVTLFAGAQFGLVPGTVIPRYDLALTAASLITTPGGKTYLHGAVPRLRLSYLGPAQYETHDTRTQLNGWTFALGACWSPIYDTRGWVAILCGEYGAGFMNLRSKDAQGVERQNKTSGLGFASLGVETQYNLGSLIHLGLKVGADIMVDSFSAERADGSHIFESSRFTGYGMLGLGVHF
jgi:hypothetical protein